MAYQESGMVSSIQRLPKKKKVLGTLGILFGVLLLTVLLWFAISPRSLTQLVCTDKAYANVVVSKNMNRLSEAEEDTLWRFLTEDDVKYSLQGNVSMNMSDYVKGLLGGNYVAGQITDYFDSTDITADFNRAAGNTEVTFTWADSDTLPILDVSYKEYDGTRFLKSSAISEYWLSSGEQTGNGDTESVLTSAEAVLSLLNTEAGEAALKSAEDHFREFEDAVTFRTDNLLTFGLGEKNATGDRVNLRFKASDLQSFLTAWAADVTDNNLKTAVSALSVALENAGAGNVSLDLYVNQKNDIIALDFLMKADEDIAFSVLFTDDNDGGMVLSLREGTETVFAAEQNKQNETNGTVSVTRGEKTIEITYRGVTVEDGLPEGYFVTNVFTLENHEALGNLVAELTLEREKDGVTVAGSMNSEVYGALVLNGTLTRNSPDPIVAPSEYANVNTEAVAEQLINYLFAELPERNANFSKMITSVLQGLWSNYLNTLSLTASSAS